MKKIIFVIQLVVLGLLISSPVMADGHGWGHHHHHGGWGRPQINNYYYPRPRANYYYQQPPVVYYQQPPVVYQQPNYYQGGGYYDGRSHQGLAGGVIGTVFGYELGNGHPLAAGIGAAAGSFLGNGVDWRY
jgi:hypothetical protein